MNKKQMLFLLSVLLIGVIASQAVQAQLFDSPIFERIGDFLSSEVGWPPYGPAKGADNVEWGSILAVYALLIAALYIGSERLPMYKDIHHKGALSVFIFALALLATTRTTVVSDFAGVIDFGTSALTLGFWLLVILAAVLFVKWYFKDFPGAGRIGEAIQERGEQVSGAAARKIGVAGRREEKDLAQEAQLFQALDNIEGQGIREAEHLNQYLNEMINLLGSGQNFKMIIAGIRDRLGRLNASFRRVSDVVAQALNIDTQVEALINDEVNRLKVEMKTANIRNMKAAGMPLTPAQVSAATRQISKYLNGEAQKLNADRQTSFDMVNRSRRLHQLRADFGPELQNGLNALAGRDLKTAITTAKTHFIQARAIISEITAIMHTIQTEAERLKRDTKALFRNQDVVDHLANASVI